MIPLIIHNWNDAHFLASYYNTLTWIHVNLKVSEARTVQRYEAYAKNDPQLLWIVNYYYYYTTPVKPSLFQINLGKPVREK